jgi:hypothetical protein
MAGEVLARTHEPAHSLLIQSRGGCYPAASAIAFVGRLDDHGSGSQG